MTCRLAVAIALISAAALAGCDRNARKPVPQAPPAAAAKTEWTADDISKDPVGYLHWSDRQAAEQIARTEEKLRGLAQTRSAFESKRQLLLQNITDVENIHKRLADAYQRAEDEDRWPVRMADRTFTRPKAQAILDQTRKYVEERKPFAQNYDQLLRKLDDTAGTLRGDIGRLNQLREKIALDIEQVRLNQGLAEVEKLRSTESQLRAMSGAVASLSGDNDPLKIVPPKEPPGRVNIEEMLK